MKKEDIETKLGALDVPAIGPITHQQELKIPLLSYKKSSRMGLWLLVLPVTVAIIVFLKHELGIGSPFLDSIKHYLGAVDSNPLSTYLIPLVLVGFPLLTMTLNLIAICHFAHQREKSEFLITIKIRLLNILLFFLSFVVFVYFLLPDRLSF